MKIRICCDNGANIHSKRHTEVSPDELGYTEEEWNELGDFAKHDAVDDWIAGEGWVEIWYEEVGE